jgi:fibro-slime domain-containing protein
MNNMNKFFNTLLVIISVNCGLSNISHATIITYPVEVTFRDFTPEHVDFDGSHLSQLKLGMVGPMLVGGVPVYVGSDGYGAVDDANSFADWYADCNPLTPAQSCIGEHQIDIDAEVNTETGTLTYSNSSFFPLDDIIPDDFDTHNNHNYYFTAQFELTLNYNAANTNTFNFTGDDDVWVFINDELVLDIGGIHPQKSASFDMSEIAAEQNILEGEEYTFSFFFAERHFSKSNVHISSALGEPVVTTAEPNSFFSIGLALLILLFFSPLTRSHFSH